MKADFHLHTSDCPKDSVGHSPQRLIDHAAALGFEILAITEHEFFSFNMDVVAYAHGKGILLIPGVEAEIEKKHVIILNATEEAASLRSFDDLRSYKQSHPLSFILAAHPFYLAEKCLGDELERNIGLFDGVEYSHFYSPWLNSPNKKAAAVAAKHDKPLIGTSDAHLLVQVGRTYTLVDAEKNVDAIITALKQRKIQLVTTPFSFLACLWIIARLMFSNKLHDGNRRCGNRR